MVNLEDRLREIVADKPYPEQAIADIKAAFSEAGYRSPEQYHHLLKEARPIQSYPDVAVRESTRPPAVKINDIVYMTGQEWLTRFEKELKRQGSNTLEPRILRPEEIEANVLEAAKRASGVSG